MCAYVRYLRSEPCVFRCFSFFRCSTASQQTVIECDAPRRSEKVRLGSKFVFPKRKNSMSYRDGKIQHLDTDSSAISNTVQKNFLCPTVMEKYNRIAVRCQILYKTFYVLPRSIQLNAGRISRNLLRVFSTMDKQSLVNV